jgi:WD40 repeat protein
MAKLFVSYSRKDSIAARKLIEAFKSIQQEVWVDWESIPPAVDWLEQVFRGIEEADAFLFLISPDSVASEVCKVEITRAALNNKRIIPIVLRDVDPQITHEDIRKLNWTFMREADNFEEGLAKVKTAIELDLDWLEEHRRLLVRSLEWHRRKDPSLLLRGRDLRNARQMVATATSKDPLPTDLQRTFIQHSSRSERNRLTAWIATGVALLIMAVLSYLALINSREATRNADRADKNRVRAEKNAAQALLSAKEAGEAQRQAEAARRTAEEQREKALAQERIASSQRSAARAQIYQSRTGELYTSTLLAIDSWKKSPSDEAEEILRKNISLLPLPVVQDSQNAKINALELNPNGESFLTASDDGTACMWNLKARESIFCAPGAISADETPPPINDAIFALGGKSIVTADEAGIVRVLNAETGEVEREFQKGAAVRDLDIGPDGRTLSISRENGLITIVDIQNTKSNGYNLTLTGKLTVADFSPNGQWMAAGSESGTVTVWNLGTRKIYSSGRHKGEVLTIQFSPNNRFVISGGADNYAVGFDTQKGEEVFRMLHSDWVRDVAFPANTSWFATASDDARVRIWDLNSGKERLILFQEGAITHVKISPDGKWIAATGEDNTVRVWSVYTGVEAFEIPLDTYGAALAFSKDNGRLISADGDGGIGIWDISGMRAPLGYVPFDKLTWISKFTPTGDKLIAADANRVWLLDPESISDLGARPPANSVREFENDIYDLVISPDSQRIGLSTYANEYVIYNLTTRNKLEVNPSTDAYAIAFSADGSRFITGTTEGDVEVWDVTTAGQINSINIGEYIYSIASSPSGTAVGVADKIILLDVNAEQKRLELESPGENRFVAFNSDGSRLAAANSAGQVQIWKYENGNFEPLKNVKKQQPYSLTFNSQGNFLAVATLNNVYIIDVDKGEEVSRIPHKGIVYNVSFSPDGTRLATASLKMIQLWDLSDLQKQELETPDLITTACSRLIWNFNESQWKALFGDQPYEKLCENLPVP